MQKNNHEEFFITHRGKYILINNSSDTNNFLKSDVFLIQKNEYDKLEKNDEILHEYLELSRKVKELKANYNLILNARSYWESKLETLEGHNLSKKNEYVFISFNRRLTNFVVSFKTLIDDIILKHKLPKIFGKDSEEVKKFKAKTSKWYDENFSYRFLIRLRDFSVHFKMPIQIVDFDINFDEKREKKLIVEIDAKFRKETILEFKDMRRIFEEELKNFPPKFDLIPILKEFDFFFDEIYRALIEISNDRYVNCAKFLNSRVNKFDDPKDVSYGVISLLSDKRTIGPITNKVNIRAIKEILKYHKPVTNNA